MGTRDRIWPSEHEVDRRERAEGLAPARELDPHGHDRGALVPRPGAARPGPLGAGALGRLPPRARNRTPRPPPDRRRSVLLTAAFNAAVGLWLVVSPVVLGYAGPDPVLHDAVAGIAIVTFAALRAVDRGRHPSIARLDALLGLWLFGAAFWLADSEAAAWNEAFAGTVIVMVAVVAASHEAAAHRAPPAERAPGASSRCGR